MDLKALLRKLFWWAPKCEFPLSLTLPCSACDSRSHVTLSSGAMHETFLACPQCGKRPGSINVGRWKNWIHAQVDRKRKLRSRKQAARQSDPEISFTGLAGELAACILICPGHLEAWKRHEETGGNNRGCDLRPEWTGLDKPIEVKEQPFRDHRGLLIIRPRDTRQPSMSESDVDDCYYVLMHRQKTEMVYTLLGWIDRQAFLDAKSERPAGWAGGSQACWVLHWKKMRDLTELGGCK